MTGFDSASDAEFSVFVSDSLRSYPEPDPDLVGAAKELWELRTVGEELGRLVLDSAEAPLVGVRRRGRPADRDLIYEFARCEVSLRVDGRLRLLGQVLGAGALSAQVVTLDGRHSVEIDANGRFRHSLRSGPFHVALVLTDQSTVSTGWALI